MEITFDPAKNERNIRERGLSFELAAEFDFGSALTMEDIRHDYGESRVRCLGLIGPDLHALSSPFAVKLCESSACGKPIAEKGRSMKKLPNPEMIDVENPEWTKEDFARAVPFSQLPESLQVKLRSLKKPRGPQKTPTKEAVTIRLSQDVVEQLRASGPGWQTRVDSALREWIEKQPKRRRA